MTEKNHICTKLFLFHKRDSGQSPGASSLDSYCLKHRLSFQNSPQKTICCPFVQLYLTFHLCLQDTDSGQSGEGFLIRELLSAKPNHFCPAKRSIYQKYKETISDPNQTKRKDRILKMLSKHRFHYNIAVNG